MAQLDFDLKSLRKAVMGVSGAYGIGLPLTFLMNVMLARMLSVDEFGEFGFALSLIAVLSIPVIGGLPMLLTREVSGYVQSGALGRYRGIVTGAHVWVLILTICIVASVLLYLAYADDAFDGIGPAWKIALCLLPILGLNAIRGGIMKGLGYPALSELPTQIFLPVLLIAGYWIIFKIGGLTVQGALSWYIAANIMVLIVAYALLAARQPTVSGTTPADYTDLRQWLSAMVPFAAMSAMWTLSAQIAVILLGFAGDIEGVAAMRVAERGAMLIGFPLMFINASIGPHIVNLYKKNDLERLQMTARYAARMAALGAVPLAIVLWIGGRFLISVTFGENYAEIAFLPMSILVMAHVMSVLLGPAGIILAMTGHEKISLWAQVISILVFLAVAVLLIGPFGASGAALGAGSWIVLSSILFFVYVHRKFGIRTSVL